MAEPKRIEYGNENSGICVEYIKSRKEFYIWGWYDHYVGIEGLTIRLVDFLNRLGIDSKELRKVIDG